MEITNVRPELGRESANSLPAQPQDRAAQHKAQVRPVEAGAGAARSALDEQRLRREEEQSRNRPSQAELEEALAEVQTRMDKLGTNLQFVIDQVAEEIVVQVTHKKSGELIRQIPSEDVVRLRQKLEELSGLLFSERV